MFSLKRRRNLLINVGDHVRVRRLRHSPLPGEVGTVTKVSLQDECGAYLVRFGQGEQFRYTLEELELTDLKATVSN